MSRSLTHLAPLKHIVNSHVKSAGFSPSKRGVLRRDVGDVSWFFDLGRPYDYGGLGAYIDPAIMAGSQAWRDKVGISLSVGPGASQLVTRLATLPGDIKAPGIPMDDASWEISTARIIDLWEVYGLPLLESAQNTDDLVKLLRNRQGISLLYARERLLWAADVWEGYIDPQIQSYISTTPRYDKKEVTNEEMLSRLHQERLNRTPGTG